MDRFNSQTLEDEAPKLPFFFPQFQGHLTLQKVYLNRVFHVAHGHMPLKLTHSGTMEERLNFFGSTLGCRSTTKESDEALCLASLIGCDLQPIMDHSINHQARMKAFFTSLNKVPVGVLFSSKSRIAEDGYRWIPSTCLWRRGDHNMPDLPEYGSSDRHGLRFCRTGLKFRIPSTKDIDPIALLFRPPYLRP